MSYHGVVRWGWVVLLLLSFGCLEKIETASEDTGSERPDGGQGRDGGGLFDSGDPRDGGDAGPAGDGGVRDGAIRDGGEPDTDAEPPPLSFGMMQLPPGQVSITTIWGRSSQEIYAGTSNGNVLAFDPQQGWAVAWHEPSNFGIRKIRGTSNRLFVASETTLWVHDGPLGQTPSSFAVGQSIEDIEVVDDDDVYLVAGQVNGRGVYRFDGNDVQVMNDQLEVAVLYGVHAEPNGSVIVSGNGKIFRYEAFTWTEDTIDWPMSFSTADIANFDLHDVTRVGDHLLAVGEDHHVLEYDPAVSRWRYVYEPANADQPLLAMAPLSGTEAYAVGWPVAGGPIVRFIRGTFVSAGYPNNHTFRDLWVASSDEIYLAGNVRSTFDPVISKGSR